MLSSGEFDEAISFYRRLIQIDDSNAKSWNDLGECYMKKKKYLMVNFNASNVITKD
jgi:Flp pilus assembly protein TadD